LNDRIIIQQGQPPDFGSTSVFKGAACPKDGTYPPPVPKLLIIDPFLISLC